MGDNKVQTLAQGIGKMMSALNLLRSRLNSDRRLRTRQSISSSVERSENRKLGVDSSSVAQGASGLGARGDRSRGARAQSLSAF